MIAFEVHRNGEKICTAGVSAGVMTAVLSWVGGRKHDEEAARRGVEHRDLTLHVGGLLAEGNEAGQHLKWRDDQLKRGDSVLIRVVDADTVDTPTSTEPQDPELAEKQERDFYERLREKYGNSPR
jgi:hypothetical protein